MWRTALTVLAAQSDNGTQRGDFVSEVGDEIRVALDRWSLGHLAVGDAVAAAGVLAIGALAAWLIGRLSRRIGARRTGVTRTAIAMGGLLAASSVMLLAISFALEVLGFSLGPILIIVLVLIVALMLLRPLVTNLSSGLLLQMRGALSVGALVRTNGFLGVVSEINARSVVLKTADGREVRVPNSDVLNDAIDNYDARERRRSSLEFMVGRDTDIDATIAGVLAALNPAGAILDDPAPDVQAAGITGPFVILKVLVWHPPELAAQRAAIDEAVRAVLRASGDGHFVLDGPQVVTTSGYKVTRSPTGGAP